MSLTIKIISNGLPALSGQLRSRASAIVKATAHSIEADAKQRVPVDTGSTRASIAVAMEDDLTATIGPSTSYSVFLEVGTVNMSARPFMTPAAEAARGPFETALKGLFD